MKNKFSNKKVIKLFIITLLFFINVRNIKADLIQETNIGNDLWNKITGNGINANAKSYSQSTVNGDTTDLLEDVEKREDNGFVVCAYSCTGNNIGSDAGKCGDSGSNFAAIFYNTEKTNNWRIETDLFLKPVYLVSTPEGNVKFAVKDITAHSDITKFTWKHLGSIIPSGGIYYEAPTGSDNKENWLEEDAYNNLRISFKCPTQMYYNKEIDLTYGHATNYDHLAPLIKNWEISKIYDSIANGYATQLEDAQQKAMELCFADEYGKCDKRNEKKKLNLPVTFFASLEIPTTPLTTFDEPNVLSYSLVQELNSVLNIANTDMNGLDSKRIFEKQSDICSLLKKQKYDKLISTETYEEILNEILRKRVDPSSPNRNMYETSKLITLLIPGKSKNNTLDLTYNSQSLTEKYKNIETIYKNKIFESIELYAKQCDIDTRTLDKTEISKIIDNKLENIVVDYGKLDYSELNCDNLFADMADMIRYAYFVLEIIAILIVIIRTGLDYSKVFLSDDKDQLKKANSNLMKRIIVLVVLLLLPAILNLFLKLFKIEGFNSENPMCIQIKQK